MPAARCWSGQHSCSMWWGLWLSLGVDSSPLGEGESCSLLPLFPAWMQQKALLLFGCNSGLHSQVRPALTSTLLSLQPLQDLREVVLNILKAADQTPEGNTCMRGHWSMGRLVSLLLQAGKQHGLQSVPAPLTLMETEGCESPES